MALPALAQQPATSTYPPACDASKVSKSDVDRAHTVFLSGKQFLEESNYEKAISYFKDAYSIDCSIHAILPIIATAYERKGDKGEAVHALEEYQRRASGAPDHEVIDRRIHNMKDQIARDQAPTAAPTTTAAAPPAPSASAPAASEPPPAPAPAPAASGAPEGAPSAGGHSAAPWAVVGVGGAVLVAGVVMYAVGAGDVSTATSECGPAHTCPSASVASEGNNGRTLETVGVVAGVLGVAAVTGGIIWHVLEKPDGGSTAGTVVSPVVAPGYAGITLGGAF